MANRPTASARPLTSSSLRATATTHRSSGFMAAAARECETIADHLDAESERLDSQVAWCSNRERCFIRAANGVDLAAGDWGLDIAV